MSRFIRLVADGHDTPTLIQRIAEHYPNLVYCSAFVTAGNKTNPRASKLHQDLKEEIRRQGLSFESIHDKLTAVAAVLGLGNQVPESGQTESIQADYYKILGVRPEADALEIKKAYRARALQTHPDTAAQANGRKQTREDSRFLSILEAYNVLSNPALKRHYDVSRQQKSRGQWSEDATISEMNAPTARMPSILKTSVFPLVLILLLLIGITAIADFAIRESSLYDGMETTAVSVKTDSKVTTKPDPPKTDVPATQTILTATYNTNDTKSKSDALDTKTKSKALPAKTDSKVTTKPDAPKTDVPATQTILTATYNTNDTKSKSDALDTKTKSIAVSAKTDSKGTTKPDAPKTDVTATQTIQTDKIPEATASRVGDLKKYKQMILSKAAPASETTVASQAATDFTGPLTRFLSRYCRAYENRDLDRFMAFFSENAVENNTPVYLLKPNYRNNFKKVAAIEYAIDLKSYTLDLNPKEIQLNGRFSLQWQGAKDREWRQYRGAIQMGLVAKNDSFLIQHLNYQFDHQ